MRSSIFIIIRRCRSSMKFHLYRVTSMEFQSLEIIYKTEMTMKLHKCFGRNIPCATATSGCRSHRRLGITGSFPCPEMPGTQRRLRKMRIQAEPSGSKQQNLGQGLLRLKILEHTSYLVASSQGSVTLLFLELGSSPNHALSMSHLRRTTRCMRERP